RLPWIEWRWAPRIEHRRPARDLQMRRLVNVPDQPGRHRRRVQVGEAYRRVLAGGLIQVTVEQSDHRSILRRLESVGGHGINRRMWPLKRPAIDVKQRLATGIRNRVALPLLMSTEQAERVTVSIREPG